MSRDARCPSPTGAGTAPSPAGSSAIVDSWSSMREGGAGGRSGLVREGLLRDARRRPRTLTRRRSRRPTASSLARCIPTRTRATTTRSALQGGRRGLLRALRPGAASAVRRASARCRAAVRGSRPAAAGGTGGFEDLLGGLFGGGGAGGRGERVRFSTAGGANSPDLEDLLGGMFGGGAGYGGYGATRGPRRGQDLTAATTLGFREAVSGATVTLRNAGRRHRHDPRPGRGARRAEDPAARQGRRR